jgi:soluble lytic murein transglycosylase-like protein
MWNLLPLNDAQAVVEKGEGRYSRMRVKMIKHLQIPAFSLGLSIILLLLSFYARADVYQYVDEKQVIHLTNIPAGPQYRVLIKERSLNFSLASDAGPFYELIAETAGKYGVDGDLVKAVVKAESNFNHKAISKKGAKGLMQLMPKTATNLGVNDCFQPDANIDGGIRHLSYLISLYNGDLPLALAAYNAGEGAVARYRGVPPYAETMAYVRQVIDFYDRYKKSVKNKPLVSASLN